MSAASPPRAPIQDFFSDELEDLPGQLVSNRNSHFSRSADEDDTVGLLESRIYVSNGSLIILLQRSDAKE